MKILVVDDNKENLYMLESLLRGYGYDVKSAADGVEALKKAEREDFDMIISDILMPRMDGFQLCREIKKNRKLKKIAFVFYTSTYTEPADQQFALSLGADRFIVKPAEPDVFIKILEEVIKSYETKKLKPCKTTIENETIYLKEYNERLIKKLEDKMVDLKTVNRNLKESERKYRELIENANDAVIVFDTDGYISFANPKFCEMTGYSIDEAKKMHFSKLIHPDDLKIVTQYFKKSIAREEIPRNYELRLVSKEGKTIYIDNSANTIEKEGGIIGIMCIMRDITKEKQAQEEKEKIQTQLRQAQKMEALGTLAGGIAHDFNNILTAIFGYVEISLLHLPGSGQIRSNLEEVINAANRAKDLVQQILTFSRVSDQERKPLKLQYIIKEALKLLRSTLPTTIEIRQKIDANCGAVLGDPTQIHQVIMNLCTNAYHAMRDNGGVLEIKLEPVRIDSESAKSNPDLHEGDYLKLSVSDTGRGMDKETTERMFDPFFTTKSIGEGTGLGLSVVHGIVKSHDGAITFSSEPDKGTTFDIYLPQIKNKIAQEIRQNEPVPRGNEYILFVDDEEPIVNIGKHILENLGYKVTAKTDSKEALKAFRKNPDKFDLVITDQTMPNMAGVEFAGKLLQIRPDIPIILMTGFSEMVTPETVKKMGIREYVKKPIVVLDLAKAIRRALNPKSGKK